MLGELNQEQINHVLYSQVIGRIGCYADGKVYVVPVTYVYDGQYVYGHTREGLKIEMMRKNPAICFEVDSIQNMANWQSVIIQGKYEELSSEDSQQALRLLINRVTPLMISESSMPSHGLDIHRPPTASHIKVVTFRIKVLEKSGRYEKR
jgi:nitroimidazol reductase NimA-like FMN-containing flavoprotein (pyridoxamine 5'-phosphate oxidase superfamily)